MGEGSVGKWEGVVGHSGGQQVGLGHLVEVEEVVEEDSDDGSLEPGCYWQVPLGTSSCSYMCWNYIPIQLYAYRYIQEILCIAMSCFISYALLKLLPLQNDC